ncbi:MAG: glycosyltransferase [Elusimicrobia bacterium]|nr:glycosyltransferase [Elusimicrobiota bacterium]
MPKVSVIMNCFNGSKYLREAIDSIYAQTYKDWEIIFWDNASTDDSPEIAGSYDNKLKYFRGENTVALGQARNLALEKASGEYITFLDCDDLWLPEKLEKQIAIFEKDEDVNFIHSNLFVLDHIKNSETVAYKKEQPQGYIFEKALADYAIAIVTTMVRKKVLDQLDELFDSNLNYASDYDLFLRIFYKTEVKYLNESLAVYRIHSDMFSIKSVVKNDEEIKYVIEKFKCRYKGFEKKYSKPLRKLEIRLEYSQMRLDMDTGNFKAVRYHRAILKLLDIKLLLLYLSSFLPKKLWFALRNVWNLLRKGKVRDKHVEDTLTAYRIKSIKSPKVTVIMPVYNSEKYLKEAINSILGQTFTDFEFLIFNDGSTDRSAEIIRNYKDPRIVFFDYKKNSGHTGHLNEGIRVAKGKYIARMDSDDISLPQRLEKQVDFMERNPDFGVCGTQVMIMASSGNYVTSLHLEDKKLRSELFFYNVFAHPSVIMRKSVLRDHNLFYRQDYYPAEDYKMWVDVSQYSKLGNIPEVLLKYREHPNQITRQDNTVVLNILKKFYKQRLYEVGINLTQEELEIHNLVSDVRFRKVLPWINEAGKWFLRLKRINQNKKIYPEPAFSQVLAEKWFDVCKRQRCYGIWVWKIFIQWPLFNWDVHLSTIESMKIFAKNLIRLIIKISKSVRPALSALSRKV